jgi:hypothetical protein
MAGQVGPAGPPEGWGAGAGWRPEGWGRGILLYVYISFFSFPSKDYCFEAKRAQKAKNRPNVWLLEDS